MSHEPEEPRGPDPSGFRWPGRPDGPSTRTVAAARGPALPALLLGFLLAAAPAPGQEPDSAGAGEGTAVPDSLPAVALEPLTVTVLRTPVELLDAPFAVSAVDAAGLRGAGPGLALDEALLAVPGVQVDDRHNYALGDRISVRGFGARAQFGVRGLKVLLDGIPATLADGQTTLSHVDPSLLGRVEVVRGPASTLYGNASGGVLRLTSPSPPAGAIGGELRVEAGGHGLRRLESRTGGRAGGVGYAAALSRVESDGFREWSAYETLRTSLRADLPVGAGTLRIRGHAVDYDALNPGSLSDSLLAVDRTLAYAFNVAQRTGEEGRQGQLGVAWEGPLGRGRVEASAYALRREIDNPIPPAVIDLDRSAGGLRLLYRGAPGGAPRRGAGSGSPGEGSGSASSAGDAQQPVTDGDGVRWALGVEADLQRDDRRNFENEGGERGPLTLDQEESVTGLAAFGELTVPVSARIDALAGLRWDRIRFEADDRLVGAGPAGDPDDSGSRTMDAVSPSLGISVDAFRGVRIYGNAATAFETPTTTELVNTPEGAGGFNPALEPRRTLSLEAGVKGRVRDRFVYQAAAYRARVDDQLVPFEVPGVPGRRFFRNAGSSIHRGVETAVKAWTPPGLLLEVAYTHTDARFDDYRTPDGVFDGNRIPGVAPHRLEGAVTYRRPGGAFLRVEGRWTSDVPADDGNTAEAPSHHVIDLRAGTGGIRLGGVEVTPTAGVDNLLDRAYVSSVVVNAFGDRYFEPGPGRTAYVGVSLGFRPG